jgi:hypothetical protein
LPAPPAEAVAETEALEVVTNPESDAALVGEPVVRRDRGAPPWWLVTATNTATKMAAIARLNPITTPRLWNVAWTPPTIAGFSV